MHSTARVRTVLGALKLKLPYEEDAEFKVGEENNEAKYHQEIKPLFRYNTELKEFLLTCAREPVGSSLYIDPVSLQKKVAEIWEQAVKTIHPSFYSLLPTELETLMEDFELTLTNAQFTLQQLAELIAKLCDFLGNFDKVFHTFYGAAQKIVAMLTHFTWCIIPASQQRTCQFLIYQLHKKGVVLTEEMRQLFVLPKLELFTFVDELLTAGNQSLQGRSYDPAQPPPVAVDIDHLPHRLVEYLSSNANVQILRSVFCRPELMAIICPALPPKIIVSVSQFSGRKSPSLAASFREDSLANLQRAPRVSAQGQSHGASGILSYMKGCSGNKQA